VLYDKGKLIISVLLVVGLLAIIGINTWQGNQTDAQVWALLSAVTTYVFVNGKQLVAPFTPSPMIVPRPADAAKLLEREAAKASAPPEGQDP
jgi:hypothetical protein